MAENRIRTIHRHLNAEMEPAPRMHAFGMQNPIKAFVYKGNYSEPLNSATQEPKQFRYTLNTSKLTTEQRLFYEKNGYIVIPKLIPIDYLEIYRQRFQDLCDGKVSSPGVTVMKDVSYCKKNTNEKVVNKIQDFIYDEVLFEYCKLPFILDYVEGFCGNNIKAMHTMLINKPPDSGTLTSRHPLHQDLHYFPFRPADKIVCSWTAMERVNRANGCLVAIPGSHTGALHEHGYPDWKEGVNKMYHGITDMDEEKMAKRVHLEMDAGDTVFFHPLLIHGSGSNNTTGFRKAISCHFAPAECEYIDIKGTTQEVISNEILEVAKKRGAELDDIRFIFQVRARLVRGQEANL